VVIQFLPGD